MKKPWQSKTVWTNLIVALSAFVPPVQEYIAAHPDIFILIFASANLILRLVSKDQISID